MSFVNVHKAKTELSKLLQRVSQGEEVVIAKAGKPIARLVPVATARPTTRLGLDTNNWKVPADFNDPLSKDFIDEFWN